MPGKHIEDWAGVGVVTGLGFLVVCVCVFVFQLSICLALFVRVLIQYEAEKQKSRSCVYIEGNLNPESYPTQECSLDASYIFISSSLPVCFRPLSWVSASDYKSIPPQNTKSYLEHIQDTAPEFQAICHFYEDF